MNLPADEPQRSQQNPLANYQFSSEEVKALTECNTESFFQRSLPFGTGLGVATYFGVKNGFLKPNVKYGAVPKVVVGVIVGYFVGKFSYQQKCAEKLMRLPNSRLGEMLRQRRQGGGVISSITPDQNLGRAFTLAPFPPSQTDVYSDEGMKPTRSTVLNLDTESRPTITGLDDTYRPSLDSPTALFEPEIPIAPAKPGTTYEDLRKQNRDDYLKRTESPYSRPLPPEAPVVIRQQEPVNSSYGSTNRSAYSDTSSPQSGNQNKYGDTWSD